MAQDVFISYSSKDKSIADAACALLETRGIRCWMAPRDILPGSEWGAAIIGAISSSRVMVLIFTSNSNASPQVHREVERAVARGLHVIPFRVEDVPMSPGLEYFISTPHWLDAITPPLERHLDRLARIIQAVLDAQSAPADGASSSPDVVRAPVAVPQSPAAVAATPGIASKSTGNRTKIILGGGVAALLVMGVIIFTATRSHDENKTTAAAANPSVAPPAMPATMTSLLPARATAPEPSARSAVPKREPIQLVKKPKPSPPAAGEQDVKRFWELLAQGNARIPRLQELLDDFPKLADRKNPSGNTPLYEAAKTGQGRVVTLLLSSGADRKLMSTGGNTVLHGAAEGGLSDREIVEQLATGNLDAKNADGQTALHVAVALGNMETVRLIAEAGADVNVPDKSGRVPLLMAMALDDPAKAHAIALTLVNAGAKTDVADKRGNSPLHLAAAAGDAVLLVAMLDKGAKVDRAGATGRTPLHLAARSGKPEAVKALLARRAAVDAADDQGNTPLHLAAALNDTATAHVLLAAGAKVTAATDEKYTPLHVAAAAGNSAMVELLLRSGGSVVLTSGKSPTPLEVAERAGKTQVVQALRKMEFPVMLDAAIRSPTQPTSPRLLEMLRKNPQLAQPQGSDGRNALHLCAISGNAQLAAELIKIDPALVRAFSASEEQPLHLAAQNRQTTMAKVLLVAGASVRATMKNGDTPLHCAARAGATDIVRAMLDAGADPDITNKDGSRPTELARDTATRELLVAAEREASSLRAAWSAFQLEGRSFDLRGPGLSQPLRVRFRRQNAFGVEGEVDGTFKSFTGVYRKGPLTLSLESADGPIFRAISGTTYSGKVSVADDDSGFTLKVGNAEISFERR